VKDIYKRVCKSPSMGWVLWYPWCFINWFSLSLCEKPKTMFRTQMGAQMKRHNNGDDDNDHDEEWMENPTIYNKVLSQSRKWRTIK